MDASIFWLVLSPPMLAVYFEQGDYPKTIETGEKAIEEGRAVSFLLSGRRWQVGSLNEH